MIIDVENVGQVEFPDDATQEEIGKALNERYSKPSLSAERAKLSDSQLQHYVAGGGPMAGLASLPTPGPASQNPMGSFISLPRLHGQSLAGKAGAAVVNTAEGLAEGAISPLGLATSVAGPLPKLAHAAIGAGFGIPALKEGLHRVYSGAALGDTQESIEGALQALTGGGITIGAAHGALKKGAPNAEREITGASRVPVEQQGIPVERGAEVQAEAGTAQRGGQGEQALPQPAEVPQEVAPEVSAPKPYAQRMAEAFEEEMKRSNERAARKLAGQALKPTTNLPSLIKDVGRPEVERLIGEWDQNAELHPSGKSIVTLSDPRNQTGRTKASITDFLSWYEEHKAPPSGEAGEAKPGEAPVSAASESPVTAGATPQAIPESSVTTSLYQVGSERVGMGGALYGEIPDTGSGADIYGIAQRIREERAKAGQTAIVDPGQGMSAVEAVVHGQDVLENDPLAAQKAADQFSKDKSMSLSGFSSVRAMGEKAYAAALKIEDEFGTDSPEYRAAKVEEEKWNRVSKDMQTAWSDQGKAQQGQTDIDTGSFTGLDRFRREDSGKSFTPEEAKTAKVVASKVKKARESVAAAEGKLLDEVVPERVDARVRSIAERIVAVMDKAGQDALMRIRERRAKGAAFSGPIDPTELDDYIIYGASKIAKGAVEFAQWSVEMANDLGDYIKPELKKIWDAANKKADDAVRLNSPGPLLEKVKARVRKAKNAEEAALDAAHKTVREAAVAVAEAENKARVAKTIQEQKVADVQRNAAQKALATAQKTAADAAARAAKSEREATPKASDEQSKAAEKALEAAQSVTTKAASDLAKAENKQRLAKTIKDKAEAAVQEKAARKALEAAHKTVREAAANAAKEARRVQDPTVKVVEAIKGYIEQGETDPQSVFSKVASDLGMSTEQVHRLLTQNKRVKYLSDEMWKKRQAFRVLNENAKRWVRSLDDAKIAQYLSLVPQGMFKAKVYGHAGVALGTHAPLTGWQLRYWPMFAQNYYKMWKLALKSGTYERMTTELQARPNYIKAQRFGLKNKFSEHDEINVPSVLPWMGKNKVGFGTRGYSVLKFLRQDLFDNIWDRLPKTQQIDEVGWVIANRVNHITGTLSDVAPPKSLRIKGDIKLPTGASTIGFAPTLLASRAKVLFKDPIQSAMIATHWSKASPGEKMALKLDVSDRLWATGTLLALLGINAGILYANNSDQKINLTDPTRSDWLKFKGFGMDFAFGNALISMARFIPRLGVQIAEQGGTRRRTYADEKASDAVWQFSRSQLSPYAGTLVDLALGIDFQKRPLPAKLFGTVEQNQPVPMRLRREGVEPYTWGEYGMQTLAPIPFQEGLKEVWKEGFGMSDAQIRAYTRAIAISFVMGTTGGRVSEDYDVKQP